MEIEILRCFEGAKRARSLAVVIDVFRAFSLEVCLFERGAEKIYAVAGESSARALKAENPDWLLIGERHGKILPGFDFGNSPFQTLKADVAGKTIVHTTSAGTQGLAAASACDEILAGSLRNASAIARYIAAKNPPVVSLCALGWEGKTPSPEDDVCAEYIASILQNAPYDKAAALERIAEHPEGKKFFNPLTQEIFPRADFELCTQIDADDFVIRAEPRGDGVFEMSRICE